jgi:outer membrane biosynthesis protein TonB
MSVARLRQTNSFHHDPKFGRVLLASLIIHGLVWLGFAADWFGTSTRPKPPVYYVDLIHKPVLNPQAGRPDPRPTKQQKAAPVKRSVTTSSAPKPKPEVKPLVKPAQTAKPKPLPKPVAKATPKKDQAVQSSINDAMERIKRQAERDALKDKIAKLAQSTGAAATIPEDVPIGMPDGTGDEVGISALAFVQGYIQQNWALSPYLLDQSRLADIEAKATLNYAANGRLKSYRISEPSGNQQFDDSLTKAIVKSQQLPQPLPKDVDLIVIFNLKEMATLRR